MTREQALQEIEEEWEVFIEGTGLKYKTEEGFQKEIDENPDLKKVVEAHYITIEALKQEPVLNKIRTEIMDTGAYEQEVHGKTEFLEGINYCLSIIDKYKAEMENEEE